MADHIAEADLRVETTSNISGASVRVTHLPTGVSAESGWMSSPYRARNYAMDELHRRLALKSAEGQPGS